MLSCANLTNITNVTDPRVIFCQSSPFPSEFSNDLVLNFTKLNRIPSPFQVINGLDSENYPVVTSGSKVIEAAETFLDI